MLSFHRHSLDHCKHLLYPVGTVDKALLLVVPNCSVRFCLGLLPHLPAAGSLSPSSLVWLSETALETDLSAKSVCETCPPSNGTSVRQGAEKRPCPARSLRLRICLRSLVIYGVRRCKLVKRFLQAPCKLQEGCIIHQYPSSS